MGSEGNMAGKAGCRMPPLLRAANAENAPEEKEKDQIYKRGARGTRGTEGTRKTRRKRKAMIVRLVADRGALICAAQKVGSGGDMAGKAGCRTLPSLRTANNFGQGEVVARNELL